MFVVSLFNCFNNGETGIIFQYDLNKICLIHIDNSTTTMHRLSTKLALLRQPLQVIQENSETSTDVGKAPSICLTVCGLLGLHVYITVAFLFDSTHLKC